jgi:hypothetical protein
MGRPWVEGGRFGVIFLCDCGKKFKAPEGTAPTGHSCPRCGGPLRAYDTSVRPVDIKVLIEQKKALRDELRMRDRQLRIAQAEIHKLKAENVKLHEELIRARGGSPFVTISEAPLSVELPSDRVDLSLLPPLEEIADLADVPQK